ncbi:MULTISPECIES: hypothetical protein [Halobacterium]|uniref:DUF6414 family protein n=1 Tax=Halobacterium TaxID=2239 RepID=UPI00073E168C|nr:MULTISPECIES: hypothetical protein [Halobacterium]MCG1001874.1 hypothetical protein [Halobacterium noricense]
MNRDVRQFVYLDSGAVNSLLASMFMAVPETVRDVAEESEEEGSQSEGRAGIDLGSLLNLGGSHARSSSETERELSEVSKRVNDQYRFSILIDSFENDHTDPEITDLTSDSDIEDIELGELVRVVGSCRPDPLYPLLSALQYIVESTSDAPQGGGVFAQLMQNASQLGQVEQFYQLLYHGWIGLEIDAPTGQWGVATTVDTQNMWVDPDREFRSQNEYTILGRVREVNDEETIWDLIEALRMMDSVSSDSENSEFRAKLVGRVLDSMDEQNESEFELPEIHPEDFILEGKSIVIDPIAIHW